VETSGSDIPVDLEHVFFFGGINLIDGDLSRHVAGHEVCDSQFVDVSDGGGLLLEHDVDRIAIEVPSQIEFQQGEHVDLLGFLHPHKVQHLHLQHMCFLGRDACIQEDLQRFVARNLLVLQFCQQSTVHTYFRVFEGLKWNPE